MTVLLIYFIVCLFILYWIIQVPIRIAKNRGITGSELNTIAILSWCGVLFIGITWFIAIILSISWQPNRWIDKNDQTIKNISSSANYEKLEKLAELKDKKIITEDEFNREKKKILMG